MLKVFTSMKVGDVLRRGQVLVPPGGGFGFVAGIALDGSFQEYSTDLKRIILSSAPGGTVLRFQTDGNVVLRNARGEAVFGIGSVSPRSAIFDIAGNGELEVQDGVTPNSANYRRHVIQRLQFFLEAKSTIVIHALVSPSGHYSLISQSDGNVVIYHYYHGHNNPIWNTHTAGHPYSLLTLQTDGRLVLLKPDRYGYVMRGNVSMLWSSNSVSKGAPAFRNAETVHLQDDGNLVVLDTRANTVVWSSHTAGKK